MDLVDVPEHRRDPGENAGPGFHPSCLARSNHRSTAMLLIFVTKSGPTASQTPIHPVNPGSNIRRSVIEVAVDSDKVRALRERLFGSWEMNWVGFNYARDFMLPGQKEGPIGFLMYPYAEAADGVLDSLDPASFIYSISAKEII